MDDTLYFRGPALWGRNRTAYLHGWTALAESGKAAASRLDYPDEFTSTTSLRQDARRVWGFVHNEGAWVNSSRCPRGRGCCIDGEENVRNHVVRMEQEDTLVLKFDLGRLGDGLMDSLRVT